MAGAIVAELLKTIAEKLGSQVHKSIVSAGDINSQIKGLQDLKNTIEATLLDANTTQVCSHSQRDVLEKLECVLGELNDFKDAKEAKAKQKELIGGSKLTKEVCTFFSTSNQLISPFKNARKIKAITGELSRYARNHAQFGSIISSSSSNQNRTLCNESGSHTSTDMVIGRDGDRDNMVSLLLDNSNAAGIISVASIVGIGGVGKTTLAQYVYNDERIRSCFDLQLWASATQEFNVKDLLRKMVASATDEDPLNYEMDQLQQRVFRAIAGKRFLLVLDSVWDQDTLRAKWLELRSLLGIGARGSKILLTTRSVTVARIMGTQDPYMVSDLDHDDSWTLFQHVAFTKWHEPGVEAIGKEIVIMSPKVPLVIRAIGSVLAGKYSVQEWLAFNNEQLTNFDPYGSDVISTLKLSYDHLSARLKLCVLYCSLFPKGFKFYKDRLIRLWIALGYVEGDNTDQSLEDVAEGYVLCLLRRGFFYSWKGEGYECPIFFRMHHLMHDLVLSIAGSKYKMADSSTIDFDKRVGHVSYISAPQSPWKVPSSLFKIKQLKSFLLPLPCIQDDCQQVRIFLEHDIFISRVQSLRVLKLQGLGINKLPRSLGEVIHLRYLDFSLNPIRKLPDSITQLVNLYLLDLSGCSNLEELPKNIGNLVLLRHLILNGCYKLSRMPKGLLRLTGLETLSYFVVGKPGNSLSLSGFKGDLACGLADLNGFNNLKGWLTIDVVDRSKDIVSDAKAANLDRKDKVTGLRMKFRGSTIEDEIVLDNLKPGANLEYLFINNYAGERLPRWMREGIHVWLPNLVSIYISECKGCMYLCSFGRLAHLKYLGLKNLDKVEYIENNSSSNDDRTLVLVDKHPSTPLFPTLERLHLHNIPALKGWWSVADFAQDQGLNHQLLKWMAAFPKLKEVRMDIELESVISLAKVLGSFVQYLRFNGKHALQTSVPSNVSARQRQPVILLKSYFPMLRDLFIFDNSLKFIPEEFRGMSSLENLTIRDCKYLEAVPEWIDSLTSLRGITIKNCPSVKSLPQEISNLSNLFWLTLHECSRQLSERCQPSEPIGEDWPKIQHIPFISIVPANHNESCL